MLQTIQAVFLLSPEIVLAHHTLLNYSDISSRADRTVPAESTIISLAASVCPCKSGELHHIVRLDFAKARKLIVPSYSSYSSSTRYSLELSVVDGQFDHPFARAACAL